MNATQVGFMTKKWDVVPHPLTEANLTELGKQLLYTVADIERLTATPGVENTALHPKVSALLKHLTWISRQEFLNDDVRDDLSVATVGLAPIAKQLRRLTMGTVLSRTLKGLDEILPDVKRTLQAII